MHFANKIYITVLYFYRKSPPENINISKTLVENSMLKRQIQNERNKRNDQKLAILRLRKRVNSFKRTNQRMELRLRKISRNCVENSGLDVRNCNFSVCASE